jgi:hypothetical protein
MSKQIDAPMVHNQFHLSAYVPNQTMTTADLINATRCQSLWILNFKRTLVNTTISKVLANWLEQTLHHSTKDTRMNPSNHPALNNGFSVYYQEACTTKSYKKKNHFHKERDKIRYGYPLCLTGEVWDAYINNSFDLSTRKEFLSKISLSCIDKKKETKMTPSYALTLENVTTDVGPISTKGQRKIDARHYNGILPTPRIVYHIASKMQNSLLSDRYGNPFEVGIINFII